MKHNDPPELLDQYYRDGRWDYLGSPEYAETYLKPLAAMCVGRVLDVGCGEGWLAEHLTSHECFGFDASKVAVDRAVHRFGRWWPSCRFFVTRLEDPPFLVNGPDTIVFGNILEVLVKPECRLPLIDLYVEKYRPQRFIVYDLEKLDTRPIEDKYLLVEALHRHCEVPPEGPKAKWSRKVLAFEVRA